MAHLWLFGQLTVSLIFHLYFVALCSVFWPYLPFSFLLIIWPLMKDLLFFKESLRSNMIYVSPHLSILSASLLLPRICSLEKHIFHIYFHNWPKMYPVMATYLFPSYTYCPINLHIILFWLLVDCCWMCSWIFYQMGPWGDFDKEECTIFTFRCWNTYFWSLMNFLNFFNWMWWWSWALHCCQLHTSFDGYNFINVSMVFSYFNILVLAWVGVFSCFCFCVLSCHNC